MSCIFLPKNKPPLIVHLNSMIKRSERNTKYRIHFKEVYVVFDLFSKKFKSQYLKKTRNYFFLKKQTHGLCLLNSAL